MPTKEAKAEDEAARAEREQAERVKIFDEKPHDYIERTKPEDRLEGSTHHPGQVTRDNVNPNIPSTPPGEGPIVQPESTSAGVPPPERVHPEGELQPTERLDDQGPADPDDPLYLRKEAARLGPLLNPRREFSLNEPPGSDVYADAPVEHQPLIPDMPPADVPPTQDKHPVAVTDPDDLEDEIEAHEDDGDVVTGKKRTKKGK